MEVDDLDWRWLKSFLAVAKAQGMHAAAKATHASQATLSRHVAQLEETLGFALFERQPRGIKLSEQGATLYEHALGIELAVKGFERQALGLNEEEAGSVRVTMSRQLGFHFAPAWLVALRQEHPHISIDLVLEDQAANLLMREAEIAVRQFPPKELDLVIRACGKENLGFFASHAYLQRHPAPQELADLFDHDLLGFDRIDRWIQTAAQMGYTFTREDFVCRTDSMAIQPELIAHGLGIGVVLLCVGRRLGLANVLPQIVIPGPPLFLATPSDLHKNPRVLRVWRHLGDHLLAQFGSNIP